MISKKLLGLAALAAAVSLAPSALAATPGSLASCTITVRQYTGDTLAGGLVATTSCDLTGVTSTVYSDGVGRVRQSVDGLGKVSTAVYDAGGNLLSRRDATGAGADYTYDSLGRKLTETDAAIAGKVRSYSYDIGDHLLTSTDPLGVVTTFAYDLRDRKISDSTPMSSTENRVIRYGYNGRGQMTTLTDSNGAVTTWGFDSAGRQTSKLYANGDHRSMAYDAAGRLVTLTDENGKDTVSVFDLAGRLLTKGFSADGTQDTYAYDAASRMTSVTKGRYNHTLTYSYDQAGRLATETHPDGEVVNFAYDSANRLAGLSLVGNASVTPNYSVGYAYNQRGQLATVISGDYASRYEYRDNGQLASTIDYRVSNPQGDILRADRSYDAGARLTQVSNTAANGDQAGVAYTLGVDDQRLSAVEENGQKWNYGYDSLKQLVTARKTDTATAVVPPLDQSYSYDPMGNRRAYNDQTGSTAYTANSANQYTAVGGIASVYDNNGNLLTDGVKNYTWDAENQLIAVTPVNPVEGSQRVEYTYDWRMRRTGKKSYTYAAATWNLTKTTGYRYHKWNPIEETIDFAGGTTEKKNYVWGNDLSGNLHGAGGVGGLLSMKYNGNAYFHAFDGNGNVRALVVADAVNPAASAITAQYAYDGFGKEVSVSGADADKNAFRFSTKQLDSETGMNYYGHRFYAADAGRWINRDPRRERGGVNIYAAAGNDMVYRIDVLGLFVSGNQIDQNKIYDWSGTYDGTGVITVPAGWSDQGSRLEVEFVKILNGGEANGSAVSSSGTITGGINTTIETKASESGTVGYAISGGPGVTYNYTATKTGTTSLIFTADPQSYKIMGDKYDGIAWDGYTQAISKTSLGSCLTCPSGWNESSRVNNGLFLQTLFCRRPYHLSRPASNWFINGKSEFWLEGDSEDTQSDPAVFVERARGVVQQSVNQYIQSNV